MKKNNGQYIKKELLFADADPSSLHTTAEDMAKWANNFDHPAVGGARLIEDFNKISLLDNNKPVVWAANRTDTTYHAKGQLHWQHRGIHAITHGGHTAGFRAWFARFPEHNLSVIALSNDEHYDILRNGLKLFEFYLKDQLKERILLVYLPVPLIPNLRNSTNLKDYIGQYNSDELSTEYFIKLQNNKLITDYQILANTK
jgi:CubicO group peptidase (beta-lactamase class C family)